MSTSIDGRRARREHNVDAVAEALLDLLNDGVIAPSAAEIAERSGVSLRSVFRYFDDLQQLLQVAVERQDARVRHLFEPLESSGSRDDRIDRLTTHLVERHRQVRAVARAARLRAPTDEAIADAVLGGRHNSRQQIALLFAHELAADDGVETLDALEAALSFENLEFLWTKRGDDSLLAPTIERYLRALLVA